MINWFCEIDGRPNETYLFFLNRGFKFKTAFGEMRRGKSTVDRSIQ